MTVGGRYRQPFFSHFLRETRFLSRKWEKVHECYPSYFPILNVPTNFHYERINNDKKIMSTVMTISHDDNMAAEKSLYWNISVIHLLKRPAPTGFELQGSYCYQKKRNGVFFRSIENFFFNFTKSYDVRKMNIFMKKKIIEKTLQLDNENEMLKKLSILF